MTCFSLVVSFCLLQQTIFSSAHVDSPHRKIPIHININHTPPEKVLVTPYGVSIEGIYINITPEFEDRYKIGVVKDDNILLSDDRENIVAKQIFSIIHNDGSKFVELDITSITDSGEVEKNIEEYIRPSGGLAYIAVVRNPIEVDIAQVELNQHVQVVVSGEQKKVFIKDVFKTTLFIGIIKYESLILDNDTQGVLYKYIVVEVENGPTIKVISYFRNGSSKFRIYVIEKKPGRISSRIIKNETADVI
ncbi:signal peptide-containing protein [Theileria equi strain WA]|uniref:Signal peptide-containing protein n=1 Tax=Theileria equi strain WA TaxID=1537102 RepID=L0AYH0_THEEQ|nr:signal peptide-containing protein [Theileria equi strain WA]AFZ80615.1 signal peptide-containing protein [Theileria equi strain WA]|eukprot:XP_004830281.1 signal peptide-containing protein [Theileria equi strain WA]